MNEKLGLIGILKNCPEGTKLYSLLHGEVTFVKIIENDKYPIKVRTISGRLETYMYDGKYFEYYKDVECVLFPSKDQRDWSKFKVPEATMATAKGFDPKKFKPFDRVLWKGLGKWRASFFSHCLSNNVHEYEIYCTNGCFGMVIPYNDETKHLLGTTNDCPEYYKWWLDIKQDDKQRPSLAVND